MSKTNHFQDKAAVICLFCHLSFHTKQMNNFVLYFVFFAWSLCPLPGLREQRSNYKDLTRKRPISYSSHFLLTHKHGLTFLYLPTKQ